MRHRLSTFWKVVERNGYSAYWYPEGPGYESMALGSYLLAKSDKLVIGSSIANIYAREPYAAKQGMLLLSDFYGDRFILGLGVSHRLTVEGMRGLKYDKPIGTMSAYLDGVHKDLPTGKQAPVVVAALGPKMLELSAKKSMGAVPYNVTPKPHRDRQEDPRSRQDPGGRAEGDDRDRCRQGARARPQGAAALHGARELPQQLAARGVQRGRSRQAAAATSSSTRCACGATPPRCAAACAGTSRPAPRTSACSRCTRKGNMAGARQDHRDPGRRLTGS
jgi:alkanesulfonate monooxygenase SsuD/methylene tetrahydromethanopterin reductase-like flavin-dependent oxidoreductase (luciferase family)